MRAPSILVVEDDEYARELYRLALSVYGYRVVPVRDGLDALRRVEVGRFSLIVLDLGLPCVGGADVVKELASHAETRSIPVVVVTGQDPQHVEGHVACVLRKPVDADALCETVRHHLAAVGASVLCWWSGGVSSRRPVERFVRRGLLVMTTFHRVSSLWRTTVGDHPLFCNQQLRISGWQVNDVARAVAAQVDTVHDIGQFTNEDNLHSVTNRSNRYAGQLALHDSLGLSLALWHPVADTPHLNHDDRMVERLQQLTADADKLHQEITAAEPRFIERRKLGIDRRRDSRTDRRRHTG